MNYWAGMILVIAAAFGIFRIKVRRDYHQKGSLSFLATLLETLIFALHANLPYLYLPEPWPKLPPLPASRWLLYPGLAAAGAGIILTLAIMASLGLSTTLGTKPRSLRRTGPYRWSRNPQLLSYGLVVLGFAWLYPSLETAGWLALYFLIAHTMVITEEEHLRNLFGKEFQDYCRSTPRYFTLTGLLRKTDPKRTD